jgi:hypothetical protein
VSPRNAILLSILLLAALHVAHFFADVEDAYISYRYAENLAAGHGLVFNPGERVEGYTNFLWVVLLACCRLLGAPVPATAQWLGFFLALGTVAVAADVGRRLPPRRWWSGLPAGLLVAANPGVAAWAASGLESALFCFLAILTVDLWTVERESRRFPWKWPLAACLAGMARPEGVLLFVVALGTWCAGATAPRKPLGRAAGEPLAVFLALGAPYFLWRWSYYGALLPNTYAAKSGFDSLVLRHGLLYVLQFFAFTGGAFLAGGALLALGWRDPTILLILLQSALYTLHVILAGGDGYPYSRFLVPVAVLLAPAAEAGFARLWSAVSRRWSLTPRSSFLLAGVLFFAFVLGGSFTSFWGRPRKEFQSGVEINRRRRPIAEWLRRKVPPGALVALNPAGVIPYFSKLRTLDQLGLTDAHIARSGKRFTNPYFYGHNRYDSDYVLSRRPDVLFLGQATLTDVHPSLASLRRVGPTSFEEIAPVITREFHVFPGDAETWRNPVFRRLYTPMIVALGGRFFYFFSLDPEAARIQQRIDSGASTAEERAAMSRILASKQKAARRPGPPGAAGETTPGPRAERETLEKMESALARGDVAAAEKALLAALEQRPEDPLLLFNLGVLYERNARLEEALAAYRRAVAAQPEYVDAWINLGTIYARRGDFTRAREAWERALSLDPESAAARDNLRLLSSQP